ncbi:MAG TPA: DUF3108 domain-containing protein [Kofleriaceae bacterium]
MDRAIIVVALALAGCAGASAATQPAGPAATPVAATPVGSNEPVELGLVPGETMAFDVHLGGVLAGAAQLAVGQIGEVGAHRAIVVKSHGETAGAVALIKQISDDTTTVIDADSGRPLTLDSTATSGDTTTTAHADFTANAAVVKFAKSDEPRPHVYRVNFLGQPAYDAHAAMAQLRGWHGAPGAKRSIYVVGGKRLWRVDVSVVGVESIGSAMGNRRAMHLEGAAFRARPNLTLESNTASRTFSLWLTDDADRVPLKLVAKTELGDVAMDLTEYNRP